MVSYDTIGPSFSECSRKGGCFRDRAADSSRLWLSVLYHHRRTDAMVKTGYFPLARYEVLDLARARAGPACVRQLVDGGAETIKIKMPGGRTGDGMCGNGHGFDFQTLHRNK